MDDPAISPRQFSMKPEHAFMALLAAQTAFFEAIKLIAATRPNDGWKEAMYQRVQVALDQAVQTMKDQPLPIGAPTDMAACRRDVSGYIDFLFDTFTNIDRETGGKKRN